MKKIAGLLFIAILMLSLAACNDSTPQETQEEYPDPNEIIADNYEDPDDSLTDNDLLPLEPQDELMVETEVFAGLNSGERDGEITHVVIHFISNVIANRVDPYAIEDIERIFRDYGFSAHYIIDRDGTIHLAVPEYRVAFHAGAGTLADFPEYENNLNQHSIGIELLGIGTRDEMSQYLTAAEYDALDPALIGFTDAQYDSLNRLLHNILARHPSIQPNRRHIIGHDEYAPDKVDPGTLFAWDRLDFMHQS